MTASSQRTPSPHLLKRGCATCGGHQGYRVTGESWAPISDVEPATKTCGVCGFALNEVGECPGCKLAIAERARELDYTGEERDVVDQVADWLDAEDGPKADGR